MRLRGEKDDDDDDDTEEEEARAVDVEAETEDDDENDILFLSPLEEDDYQAVVGDGEEDLAASQKDYVESEEEMNPIQDPFGMEAKDEAEGEVEEEAEAEIKAVAEVETEKESCLL